MEAIAHLKLIKPARAGNKIGHETGLLQLAVALHGLILVVVKGHVKALTLPMVHPRDQHLHLWYYIDFHFCLPENCVYLILHQKEKIFFFFIIFLRSINLKPQNRTCV